jgi:hypothetical protein
MTKNQIQMFFHCKKCLDELPEDKSPREWVRMEAGWSNEGLQVWCVRHEMNIIHVDLMGQKVGTR